MSCLIYSLISHFHRKLEGRFHQICYPELNPVSNHSNLLQSHTKSFCFAVFGGKDDSHEDTSVETYITQRTFQLHWGLLQAIAYPRISVSPKIQTREWTDETSSDFWHRRLQKTSPSLLFPMDKETELAYLKAVAASSQDVVNVLETIAAQFKSMEEATTRLHELLRWHCRYGPRIRELVYCVRFGN